MSERKSSHEISKNWNAVVESNHLSERENLGLKIGPMTFDRCRYILYYATLHNQYCNSQKYQSYSLTNGGAQDVD